MYKKYEHTIVISNRALVQGDFFEWNYQVADGAGTTVMSAHKELLNWTDTYVISVGRPEDALLSLMIVLAIDAAKCSQGN